MGGLSKLMPITGATFIVGWLAIAGVPPFAGFWSKDEILLGAWELSPVLWAVGLVTALLTAFYMSRQVFLAFFGAPRWSLDDATGADPAADMPGDELPEPKPAGFHPHESPWTMTLPLVALAGLAIVAGAINLPFTSDLHFLGSWLEPSLFHNEVHSTATTETKVGLAVAAILAATAGIAGAAVVYLKRRASPDAIEQTVLRRGWFIDSSVTWFMGTIGTKIFDAAAWFDRVVIDGAVNGVAAVVRAVGTETSALQSGYVRAYAVTMGLGAVGVLALILARVVA
jgi:NADH-quinone oxidoreductase subunit L